MKKTFLTLLFFVSLCGFSQTTLTSKEDKISYSEYDDLKYIKSIVSGFSINEAVYRFSENNETLLFSYLKYSDDTKNTAIYSTGTIEFVVNGSTTIKGILKKDGVNRFLTVTECGQSGCKYYMFVNNDKVWTGSAPVK